MILLPCVIDAGHNATLPHFAPRSKLGCSYLDTTFHYNYYKKFKDIIGIPSKKLNLMNNEVFLKTSLWLQSSTFNSVTVNTMHEKEIKNDLQDIGLQCIKENSLKDFTFNF